MTKIQQTLRNKNLAILCGEVAACQCEHLDHEAADGVPVEGKHEIGALHDLGGMIEIITIFGPFLVCEACFQGCHA